MLRILRVGIGWSKHVEDRAVSDPSMPDVPLPRHQSATGSSDGCPRTGLTPASDESRRIGGHLHEVASDPLVVRTIVINRRYAGRDSIEVELLY